MPFSFPTFKKEGILSRILLVIFCLILLVCTFAIGVNVGARKARHFSAWSREFNRSEKIDDQGFGLMGNGRRSGMMRRFAPSKLVPQFPGAHGVFGALKSLTKNSVTVIGRNGVEQTALVTTSTSIRIGNTTTSLDALTVASTTYSASVFGAPNETGDIEATLIRLSPQR